MTGSRRTTITRAMSRQMALALSNAVPSVADRAPIVTSQIDGQVIEKHDIVWIKHKKCLDTPVIVQNILSGE